MVNKRSLYSRQSIILLASNLGNIQARPWKLLTGSVNYLGGPPDRSVWLTPGINHSPYLWYSFPFGLYIVRAQRSSQFWKQSKHPSAVNRCFITSPVYTKTQTNKQNYKRHFLKGSAFSTLKGSENVGWLGPITVAGCTFVLLETPSTGCF